MVLSLLESAILLPYLRIETNPIFVFLAAWGLYKAQGYFLRHRENLTRRWMIGVCAGILSAAVVLSCHIRLENVYLVGQPENNAFDPLNVGDLGGFLVVGCLFYLLLADLLLWLRVRRSGATGQEMTMPVGVPKRDTRWVIVIALVLFVVWLPYFLLYYPGLLYGDSLNSVQQALHLVDGYSDHFPLFYTLFIELCLNIGALFGDITIGCAIYTVIQMLALASVLSYFLCWLFHKGVPKSACLLFLLYFALMRAFPQYAISMWKDPIFSAAVVFYGVKLADLFLSGGRLARNKGYLTGLVLCMVVLCLSRNNGIYIALFALVCLLIALVCRSIRKIRSVVIAHVAVILCILVLTGPVYDRMGIQKDEVESFSIPLQQLARVVVYGGEFSPEDEEFVSKLMPLDRWKEVYCAGLVDNIKWDDTFSKSYLSNHERQLMLVWFRTLLKNPVQYLEAWCLNTYGYWSPNLWELNQYTDNVYAGNISALDHWGVKIPVTPRNLLGSESLKEVFSLATPMPATGLVTCLMLVACLIAAVAGQWAWVFLFLPCMGNILTLFLASPMAYWPRYALASLYALPMLLAVPWLIRKNQTAPKTAPTKS